MIGYANAILKSSFKAARGQCRFSQRNQSCINELLQSRTDMFMPTRTCTRSGPYRLFIGTTGRTERDLDYGRNRWIIAFLFADCQFIVGQLDGDPGELHFVPSKNLPIVFICSFPFISTWLYCFQLYSFKSTQGIHI